MRFKILSHWFYTVVLPVFLCTALSVVYYLRTSAKHIDALHLQKAELLAETILKTDPYGYECVLPDRPTLRIVRIGKEGTILCDNTVNIEGTQSAANKLHQLKDIQETSWISEDSGAKSRYAYSYRAGPESKILVGVDLRTADSAYIEGRNRILFGLGIVIFVSLLLTTRMYKVLRRDISILQRELSLETPSAGFNFQELAKAGALQGQKIAQIEEELRSRNEELDEQHYIFQTLSDAAIVVDQELKIVLQNHKAVRLFNLPPINEFAHLEIAMRNSQFLNFVRGCFDEESQYTTTEIADWAGKIIAVRASKILWHDEAKLVLLLSDVTELRRLEQIKSDFVANVSHELKTPLTSILGYSETIASGQTNAEQSLKFGKKILKQSKRLAAIVNDLLQLSKMERQKEEIEKAKENVVDILNEVVSNLDFLIEETENDVQILVESENTTIECNRPLLNHAFHNLIENALTYGGTQSKVDISIRDEDTNLIIEVKDRGPGIAPRHQERIFERFYRTDEERSRSQGGTGLGLAIVKHAIVNHNGTVELKSTIGKGSTFTVTLPIA